MTHEELVEKVARDISPVAWSMAPEHYGITEEAFKRTQAWGALLVSKDRARTVIATIYAALSEPTEEMRSNAMETVENFGGGCGGTGWVKITKLPADAWRAMLAASPLNPETKS